MSNDKKTKPLTRAQGRLIDAAEAIWGDATTAKEAAFLVRELVLATLPHKNPGDVPVWVRRNGKVALALKPDVNMDTGKSYGYPYGIIPRLLLFWITTEAIRTKSPRLELGHSLNSFMAELGLNPETGGGKRSDAKRLRDQMERLFRCRITFQMLDMQDERMIERRKDMLVTEASELWWSPTKPEQGVLWGSWIQLGDRFYEAITAAPVPVDMRALKALKKSPLALDLYAWLVYEAFRAYKNGEARFETWEQLHAHIGGEYGRLDNFRAKVKAALVKIRLVYPGLKLGSRQGGIEVLPESLPALQPRDDLTIEGTAKPVSALAPASGTTLKTTTIERFRARFGRLDPYACQADFDAWLASKPASQQPRSYDAAFLGFAAKWVVGKV